MGDRGCDECDGAGFVFKHKDGDVFMESCPSCGQVTDEGSGFKGFWLSVGCKPNADSPPGAKEWNVRLIEEVQGRVTFRSLDPEQLKTMCSGGKTSLIWMSTICLVSEVARLQRRVTALEASSGYTWKAFVAGAVAAVFSALALTAQLWRHIQ